MQCADFYIDRTGERLVPPNDWEEPEPSLERESSAAAIAAAGIWQLACLVDDPVRAGHYGSYAIRILLRLSHDDFLATDDPEWQGVLKHGSYHEGKGLGVDESVMWGEYFLLDALDLVTRTLDLTNTNQPAMAAASAAAERSTS
jgi:unsaturated chondroitin disaccharide hydrolase